MADLLKLETESIFAAELGQAEQQDIPLQEDPAANAGLPQASAGLSFGDTAGDPVAGTGIDDADLAAPVGPDTPALLETVSLTAPDSPTVTGSLQTLANYLTSGFWTDRGQSPRWFNVTDTGTGANNGVLYYNLTGWSGGLSTVYGTYSDSNGISDARKDMAREAFAIYEAVLGIDFQETTATDTSVDFFFMDTVGAQAFEAEQPYSGQGGPLDYAIVNVSTDWYGGTSNIGGVNGYTFQTFLHEIGHALGLGHQGLYNAGSGSPTYDNSAQWQNDSWTQTMMSYWSQTQNTWLSTDSYAQLVSPMAVDWIALNDLYASQGFSTANAFTGDTVWGNNTNITAAVSQAYAGLATFAATNAFTIVDGGGTDTVDFSNYNVNQIIDLRLS